MALSETEIRENLEDAGCSSEDVQRIMKSYRSGKKKLVATLISDCRQKELVRLHESQNCLDRLDYLSYRLDRDDLGAVKIKC